MQKDIADALLFAESCQTYPEKHDLSACGNGNIAGILSQTQQERLATVARILTQLTAYFALTPWVKETYAGTTTSLVIHWGIDGTQSITIELSLYGLLAAVFRMGHRHHQR